MMENFRSYDLSTFRVFNCFLAYLLPLFYLFSGNRYNHQKIQIKLFLLVDRDILNEFSTLRAIFRVIENLTIYHRIFSKYRGEYNRILHLECVYQKKKFAVCVSEIFFFSRVCIRKFQFCRVCIRKIRFYRVCIRKNRIYRVCIRKIRIYRVCIRIFQISIKTISPIFVWISKIHTL